MLDTSQRPVAVGIDGSVADRHLLMWAAAEAHLRNSELLLLHAEQDALSGPIASGAPVDPQASDGTASAEELVSRSAALVGQSFPTVPVRSVMGRAHPAHFLLDESQSAAMLVLGTHDENRFAGALLGSVSQKLAAHARCTVVVLPALGVDTPEPTNTIAVGVSSSAGGRAALRFAFAEARSRRAEVLAVRGWQEPILMSLGASGIGYVPPPEEYWVTDGEVDVVHRSVARVQAEFPDVKVRTEIAHAPVDRLLVDISTQVALLVLGCRHEDGHRLSRLGPVGSWLLHNSASPTAIVGFTEADRAMSDKE